MRTSKSTKKATKSHNTMVVGIDEVGRGPIAGPVSVVALSMKKDIYKRLKRRDEFKDLHNSKMLSEEKRNEWYVKVNQWKKEGLLEYSYTSVSAKQIDMRGISSAIKKCIASNLNKLKTPKTANILLDGSLKAPIEFKKQKTIIGGDEKESIISLASIVAKVKRDRYMTNISNKYPKYDLDKNKGYGTNSHRKMIKEIGISDIHRESFCQNIIK